MKKLSTGRIFKAIFYLVISILNIYLIYNFSSNENTKDIILLSSILIILPYRIFVLNHKNDIKVENLFNFQTGNPDKSLYPLDKEHFEDMATSFIGFPTFISAFFGPFLHLGRQDGISQFSIINFLVFFSLFSFEIIRRMKI